MIVFNRTNPLEVNEGDEQIIIEIDPLASEITEPIEVEIFTVNGSASSTDFINNGIGVDFNAINTIATIDPNNPDTLAFPIQITEDAIAEQEENFQFRAIATEDRSLNGTVTVVILDNDGTSEPEPELEVELKPETEPKLVVEGLLPTISINNVEQLEGDSGNTNFEFTVSLSEPSEKIVSINYSTADGTAESVDIFDNLELIDAADYIPHNGTLEFAPGETEKAIVVEVLTDNELLVNENSPETFFVNLSNASNADLDRVASTGTILNDDLPDESEDNGLPLIQFSDRTFVEGNEEENTQELVVNLIDNNGEPIIATEDITFVYSTVDLDAAANLDYEFISGQTAEISEGESSTIINLTIIGDNEIESDESLTVALSSIDTNLVQFNDAQSELEAVITIQNDDEIDRSGDTSDLDLEDNESTENGENTSETEDIDRNDLTENTVFRFSDSNTGGYLYTASEVEKEFIESNLSNFELENSSFAGVNSDLENAADVYRFSNPSTGGYLYTTSETERDFLIDNSDEFVLENVSFSAFTTDVAGSIPVYRFFESNTGVHLYTANETERNFIEDNLSNYNAEGVAFYALPILDDI